MSERAEDRPDTQCEDCGKPLHSISFGKYENVRCFQCIGAAKARGNPLLESLCSVPGCYTPLDEEGLCAFRGFHEGESND